MRIAVLCATDRGLRALQCLRQLAPDAEFLVVTYPETPHEPPFVCAIESFARSHGWNFLIQTDVSKPPASEHLQNENFDLLFCFSWRHLVSPEIYSATRLGSYVIHDSLLPRYRGFSPAVWALINGERQVGVTLFEMTERVDEGRVVGQQAIAVELDDDIGTIREKGTLAMLGLLKEYYANLAQGTVKLIEQDESKATYTCKWVPEDARINWNKDRVAIRNLVRATTAPYPGAFCFLEETLIRVWKAELPEEERQYESRLPGAVCSINPDGSIGVLAEDGEIRLTEISVGDGPRAPASEIIRSFAVRLR